METNKDLVVADVDGLTDARIAAIWDGLDGKAVIAGEVAMNWNASLRKAFARAIEREVLATKAASAEPVAWMSEEGRVISADMKANPARYAAQAGFIAMYTVPLYRADTSPEAAPAAPEQAVPEGWGAVLAAAIEFAKEHIEGDNLEKREEETGDSFQTEEEYQAACRRYNTKKAKLLATYRAASGQAVLPVPAPADLTTEVERLKAAKANLIQQARMWKYEARAQRATVLGILRRLGLPEHDWEAKRLIVHHIQRLTQSSAPAPQPSTSVPRVDANTSIDTPEFRKLIDGVIAARAHGGWQVAFPALVAHIDACHLAHVARQDQAAPVAQEGEPGKPAGYISSDAASMLRAGRSISMAVSTGVLHPVADVAIYLAAPNSTEASAQAAPVEYVPIAVDSNDEAGGRHPNDKTPADDECQKALDARGDDCEQGLDPYWKWGFRAGWHDHKRLATQAAPAEQPAEWLDSISAPASPDQLRMLSKDAAIRLSIDGQTRAWQAVCDALDELLPDWLDLGGTAMEAALAAIRSLRGQAAPAEQRDAWAKWIVQRGRGLPDHACVECAPHSEILKQGFQCIYHQALALRSTSTDGEKGGAA